MNITYLKEIVPMWCVSHIPIDLPGIELQSPIRVAANKTISHRVGAVVMMLIVVVYGSTKRKGITR